MTIDKIYDKDIEGLKVASLPSRPTAPTAFGGAGYTAKEMKGAFDRLPLYIISRLNELIDAIKDADGIIGEIPSGISEAHTLKDLTRDITSGSFSTYLSVLGEPLSDKLLSITEELSRLDLLVGAIDGEDAEVSVAITDITARITDIEEALAELSGLRASCEENLELARAELLAKMETKISDATDSLAEQLETDFGERLNTDITKLRDELTGEIDIINETVVDRIDTIEAKLSGIIDLEIDCGGPGNL